MILVACSGFPGPVSRYWGEFPAVEITETELGIPGGGTIRRWLRESPRGFVFALRAPAELAESGFKKSNANRERLEAVFDVAHKLKAKAVVLGAPDDFKPTPTNKKKVKAFLGILPKTDVVAVVDFPAWSPSQMQSVVGRRAVVAYDPINEKPANGADDLVYLRLDGPAGKRSRYDDDAIQTIGEHCRGLDADLVLCVFRNVDMQVNAKALLGTLEA
jgi:uncharacterized protein YecE (DUF72 family)